MIQLVPSSTEKSDNIILQGILDRIVFHNAENGYTVFCLKLNKSDDIDTIPVVGYLNNPQPGSSLLVSGRWVNNTRFGRQFQMSTFEVCLPASIEGIKRYLSSGLIKGIGKKIAESIVAEFGEKTFQILDTSPEDLLKIKGITQKKLDQIIECWEEHQATRELMVFLQPHGISVTYAVKIYRYYGQQSLNIVKENPYRLAMDIHGIGFITADALATKLGFEKDNPLRAQAGILYTLLKCMDEGHVYYPQDAFIELTSQNLGIEHQCIEDAIEQLKKEERVICEVLDEHIGIYLTRYHHYESQIAFYLQRILHSPKSIQVKNTDDTISLVVNRLDITLAPEQMNAIKIATISKVMILTGGPGTGKTTVLNAIIQVFKENKTKILLAAPTGRAAKRMSEAIGMEARTIHRLLEYSPKDDRFIRNEDMPLVCGLLVVDEASMMDIMLTYHLLKAVPLGATIIFVGDIYQLPSVGPGNVLKDLITSQLVPVVELIEVFRQAAESQIVCNAHLMNKGEVPCLESSKEALSDFYFIRQSDPDKAADLIVDLVKNHIPRRFNFDPINDIQVLTPMHKGTVGAVNLNKRLQEEINPTLQFLQRGEKIYRLGDKVMQVRNNYEKDVFNGDIGRITHIDIEDKSIIVNFDDRFVSYPSDELDELVAAYAISIHKSQGSEYPVVVIPLMTQHYVLLQRNLVYTGVTRGKKLVIFVGESKALAIAIKNNKTQKRHTWLSARLMNRNVTKI